MADSIEEQPKAIIAQKVITPKRKYFLPEHGIEVEAESLDDAITIAEKTNKETKVING